ncbi:Enteropeptidase [Entomophthora muscae]|uniref:Enteropeptidase n=1 Tax=Entomophthora muscae TaxID=34485 RepID=A0ACC2SP36_9FUNG|nr:Enteropeptidase [Entomophthora muscae]
MLRRNIVLTTALYVQHKMEDISVSLQRHADPAARDSAPRFEVIGLAMHPEFQHLREPVNNIALLMIENTERLGCQVALDTSHLSSETGRDMVMVGWGYKKEYWEEVEALKEIKLPIFFFFHCSYIVFGYEGHKLNQTIEFCAGTEDGNPDAATVTHGSPLLYVDSGVLTLVGLHSFTVLSKDMKNSPNVFTRIHTFVPWILETLRGDDYE